MAVLRLISSLAAFLSLTTASPYFSSFCSRQDLNVLSCSAAANNVSACCVEKDTSGLMLLAQMYTWNYSAGAIPGDEWSLHGLWGDQCSGSYNSSCDNSRNYTDISSILEEYGRYSLLEYMQEHWRNYPLVTTVSGTDEELWEHEWAKHGTCMTTLRPLCYAHNYSPHLELVQFLEETVHLYKSLPTAKYLSTCGIIPSKNATYALADIESCLAGATGALPHIGCHNGYLDEIWYYFYLRGKVFGGQYVATNTTYGSNCPSEINYQPKILS